MTTVPVGPPCNAPGSALYFRPDGIVAACCASWHVLGRIGPGPRPTLREIWQGAAARTLRDAVAARDWGFGCWECGNHIDSGSRDESLAADFDDVAQPPGSPYPKYIDFALSNRCNLMCVMCNGGLSSAIRVNREHRPPLPTVYDERFFSELREFLPHLSRASFKGGEPFLAAENRRVWDLMLSDGIDCDVSVTTNGTLLTDRVTSYLRALRMSVNVSVDAVDPALLATIRVGVDPGALWRNIDALGALTAEIGSVFTMSFCLMSTNWQELPGFLREARRRAARPNVIWVDGPERYGIWALRPDELRRAAAQLRVSAENPTDELEEQDRSLLVDVAERLEAALGARPGVPVELAPTRHAVPAPARPAEHPADGPTGSCVRLTFHDGVVHAAESPPWATWLEPDQWIGVGLEELMPTISARSGGSMRGTMSVLDGGEHRVLIDFPERPDRPSLEAVYVPEDAGVSTVLLYERTPWDRTSA